MKGKEFASVVIGVAIIKCKQAGRLAGRHAACPKSNENWKISNFQKALVRVCVCQFRVKRSRMDATSIDYSDAVSDTFH